MVAKTPGPGFVDLFTPTPITILREVYDTCVLPANLVAAPTGSVVALTLSIASAARVAPDDGLCTAITDSFPLSTLGGNRVPIGGPADAITAAYGWGAEGARSGVVAAKVTDMA